MESPLARLCQIGGQVLLLGAPFTNLTLLHHVEHIVDLPDKRIDRYQMPILQGGRKVWVDIEEFDTTNGIADFGVEDYFNVIERSYISAGNGRSGNVGAAQTYLVDAEAIKNYALAWMLTNYRKDETK